MKQLDITFRQLDQPQLRLDDSDGVRRMTFVASDGTRDSAGTVLNVKGWDLKRFNKNGVIGYQHNLYYGSDPDNVIGKGKAYVKDDQLLVDVEFEPEGMNEIADKVWAKLQFGTLKAVSVGFRPLGQGSWGKGEEAPGGEKPTYYYAGQELLEVSVVNIPANPNALKKSFVAESMEAEAEALREDSEQEAPEVQAEPEAPADPELEAPADPEPDAPAEGEPEEKASEADRMRIEILARAALLR